MKLNLFLVLIFDVRGSGDQLGLTTLVITVQMLMMGYNLFWIVGNVLFLFSLSGLGFELEVFLRLYILEVGE